MAFQTSFICHCKGIEECLPRFEAVASMDIPSYHLQVRARDRACELFPQFVRRRKGKLEYVARMPFALDGIGFIGWLPYVPKTWRIAKEKLAFKEFCSGNGLRMPRYSAETADGLDAFIIKQNRSSFGENIRGPFRNAGRTDPQARAGENEYYEEFIPGKIVKAWYWDDRPVCLEVFSMPAVTGNGVQSLRQLVGDAIGASDEGFERGLEALARYQDISPSEPVPAGKTVLADFRYSSPLFPTGMQNRNVIAQHAETDLGRQLAEAGPVLWRAIPEDRRSAALYTVDAIVDGEGRVWFLEMNSNPAIHPDAYFAMFEHMFGPAQAPRRAFGPVIPPVPATGSTGSAEAPPPTDPEVVRGLPATSISAPRMRPLGPLRGSPAVPAPPGALPPKQD